MQHLGFNGVMASMKKARFLLQPDGSIRFPSRDQQIWTDFGAIRGFRRRIVSRMYRSVDLLGRAGVPGIRPLGLHVVVCGYHRSGTTLLQAMLEGSFPDAKGFGREVSAWRAGCYCWRNADMVISKMPQDVTRIPQIRNLYRNRTGCELKFLITVRDPRDVLTSIMPDVPGYTHNLDDFRVYHAFIRRHRRDSDVMIVRYEDLVRDTNGMQRKVEAFLGRTGTLPFREFYKAIRPGFEIRTLNGLRPVERSLVGRWAEEKHAERIEEILRYIPDFPRMVTELGYEPNEDWAERWREQVWENMLGAGV